MSYILLNDSHKFECIGGKLFKVCNTDNFNDDYKTRIPREIRSYIDFASHEFKWGHLSVTPEEEISIAWEKIVHMYFAFKNGFDFKGAVMNDIKYRIKHYPNYGNDVKRSLAAYIDLLRNDRGYRWGSHAINYLADMQLDPLIDLLKSEINLRVFIYDRLRTKFSILEIADMRYDYAKLSRQFGIKISPEGYAKYNPSDALYLKYLEYIDYITTDEETKVLQQKFIRENMILSIV